MNRPVQGSESREQLRAYIERVKRLEEEKKALADDIRDVYAEAKGNGFDVKALRAIVKLRKLDADERREQEAILETYMHALGMLADTPLGEHAIDRATPRPRSLSSASSEPARTLTNPRHVVKPSEVQKIADRAQARSADPPQEEMDHAASVKPPDRSDAHPGGAALVAASSSDDELDIPPELDRRGEALRC